MKHHLYLLFILPLLLGCDDSNEVIYRYAKKITQSKDYPIYLDMSEIGKIEVKPQLPLATPFKIVANDKYYFVGDMLKGTHVYEKKAGSANYLCFIECKYLKDLDIVDDKLFCNNFVDLVVLNVSNPMQISILHREKNLFNRYSSFKDFWNIPYVEGKGLIIGKETHWLTGMISDTEPNLNFTEFDNQYGNLTTKVLPYSWFTNHPENDRPYIGIIKMGTNQIYTYGTYNSWAICTFLSGTFSVREENLWSTPRGKYAPPYYYSDAYPVQMLFKDDVIFISGTGGSNYGFYDCIPYNEVFPESYHIYFQNFKPLDITYLAAMQAFFVLAGKSVWGEFKRQNTTFYGIEKYKEYNISTDATALFCKDNNLITLGNKLTVYLPSENELKLVKNYPDITGLCYLKTGNLLAVVNAQGLFQYDISDLENIKIIP